MQFKFNSDSVAFPLCAEMLIHLKRVLPCECVCVRSHGVLVSLSQDIKDEGLGGLRAAGMLGV